MPRFFVLSGPDLGRTFDLAEGAVFGRSPECEAPLRSSSVSRRHARLERVGEEWELVDLGSRNGIARGGERRSRLRLEEGAIFSLGEVELRFRLAEAPSAGVVPPPSPPPLSVPAPAPRAAAADEIELEEIELEDAPAPPRASAQRPLSPSSPAPRARAQAGPASSAAPAERGSAAPQAAARAGSTAASAPRAAAPSGLELRDSGRPILQYSRIQAQRGFALSDLGQQPWWVRLLVGLLALLVFAGLFYGAFRGTQFVRERFEKPPGSLDEFPE